MAFTEITGLSALNLVPFRMEAGDDDEFPVKMNGMQAALESYVANFHTAITAINALGTELAGAEVSDAAAIAAFQSTLDAKVAEIEAATSNISALSNDIASLAMSNVDGLSEKITELETADQAEVSSRQSAVASLQDAIDSLSSTVDGIEQSDIAGLDSSITAIYAAIGKESTERAAAIDAAKVRLAVLEAVTKSLTSIANVDLAEMQATADSIAQLIASAGGLTINSIAGLDNSLLNATLEGIKNAAPYNGRFLDFGGAFTDSEDWWGDGDNVANFVPTNLSEIGMAGFNGFNMSSPVEVGRHYYNADNYGGDSGYSDNAIAEAFITKLYSLSMGTAPYRFSAGFAIAEFTGGNSTSSVTDGDGRFRQLTTGNLAKKYSSEGAISISMLAQASGGTIKINKPNPNSNLLQLYVDGAQQLNLTGSDDWFELQEGEVYYISWAGNYGAHVNGYSNTIFHWLMAPGTKMRVAKVTCLPVFGYIPPSHVMRISHNPFGAYS